MGVKAVEWQVEGDDGHVAVRRTGDSVRVTWFCGEHRWFKLTDLPEVIANIEMLKTHDAWLHPQDSSGTAFYVRVDDGTLYADDAARDGRGRSVPWADLKKALTKAAA